MTNLPLTVPQILDVLELRTSRAAKIMFLTAALDDEFARGKVATAEQALLSYARATGTLEKSA